MLSTVLPPLPTKSPLVARVTIYTTGAARESFLLPWEGRVDEAGTGNLDVAFIALKAEKIRAKHNAGRVVVFLVPKFDEFDIVGGRIVADTLGLSAPGVA